MARFSAASLLLGILAVLFGLLGAYVVRKQLQPPPVAQRSAAPPPVETVVVPVASAELPVGRKLSLGDIAILRLSRTELREKGYDKPYMNNTQQIIGRVLKNPLKRGETFEPGSFYAEGTGPSIADKLKPGFRAMTVAVEVDSAVAGFATPGTFVDVLFRAEAERANDHPETTVSLIQGVEVLALNTEMTAGTQVAFKKNARRDAASVTLAVTPSQASALRVVAGRGQLSLAVRSASDTEQFTSAGPRTLDDLLERPVRKQRIEVFRGRHVSQVDFRREGRKATNDLAGAAAPATAARPAAPPSADADDAPAPTPAVR